MPRKEKRTRHNIVYSTNPSFDYHIEKQAVETLPPGAQDLRVMISKKGRGGKTVTLIAGFQGSAGDLDSLAKQLKVACGVGGSAKDGEILLQGDVRDKALSWLLQKGYRGKRSGG